MALINCNECGNKVSDKANTCPHCGIELIVNNEELTIKNQLESNPQAKEVQAPSPENKNMTVEFIIFLIVILGTAYFLPKIFSEDEKSNSTSSEESNSMKDKIESKVNPLELSGENIIDLIGAKVPYDKWGVWEFPITQEGTNNTYWIVYLKKANISFVPDKKTDEIIYASFGKESAKKYIDEKLENRKKRNKSTI